MTKYRIVKYFRETTPWYRVEAEKEMIYRQMEWVEVFNSSKLERCELYVESFRKVSPPVIIKEYEF